jgi:arginyl-tRNA synthetase
VFSVEKQAVEAQILAYCAEHILPDPGNITWSPIPFAGEWGISTSFFQLAAKEARQGEESGVRHPPIPQRAHEIALGIAERVAKLPGFARAEAVRGYLNVYFPSAEYARRVVDTVIDLGVNFGHGEPKGERIMVEYAQPNTHHSFHIGHARNALLGESLARIVEFAGFETIRASYPGDIGLGVITVLWAYQKFYQGQEPQDVHERGQWLLKIYAEATEMLTPKVDETPEECTLRESFDEERREMLRRWDAGDEAVLELWRVTREWSLQELNEILKMLDIHIDVWFFESDVDEPSKEIVEELIAKGIADDERPQGGAVIVKIDEKLGLTKEKFRTNVILRRDGTTLYLTKDLALAKTKFEKYQVDRSIYVVDVRQSLHLQQVFAILKLWGFPQADKCYHLSYGYVSLPEGAMSSRKGRVVFFKEVADEAERRVQEVIAEKNPDLPADQREVVARQVGLGALAYAMLSVDNNKDIIFEWDAALNFDGHTAPYIQNAHVRANSILKKAGGTPDNASFDYSLSVHEIELIDLISRFPATVQSAAQEYKPLTVATYAYDLAKAFHSFYHVVQVIQTDERATRDARLRLVAAARQAIANSLKLLDIQAPDVM